MLLLGRRFLKVGLKKPSPLWRLCNVFAAAGELHGQRAGQHRTAAQREASVDRHQETARVHRDVAAGIQDLRLMCLAINIHRELKAVRSKEDYVVFSLLRNNMS